MATVVDGYVRSWNATDRDGCLCRNGDYLTEMAERSSPTFVEWVDDSTESKSDKLKDCNTQSADTDMKQLKQCWKIRQFFNAIQRSWHKPNQVTLDALKSFPLILFSPILDLAEKQKVHVHYSGYFTDPNLASPRTASEVELFSSSSEQQHIQRDFLLLDQFGFTRLTNPTRRHCNSESDITWSAAKDLLTKLGPEVSQSEHNAVNDSHDDISSNLPRNSMEDLFAAEEELDCIPALEKDYPDDHSSDTLRKDSLFDTGVNTNEDEQAKVPTECALETAVLVDPMPQQALSVELVANDIACAPTCSETENQDIYVYENASPKSESPSVKSCPTPKLTKNVSFADEVGQALTEVFVIENSDQVTSCDYEAGCGGSMWNSRSRFNDSLFASRFTRSRLKHRSTLFTEDHALATRSSNSTNQLPRRTSESTRNLWVLCFPQPASQYFEFRQRIEHGSVSLENITLTQPDESSTTQLPQLSGTIKVKNLSYEKQVWIRLTTDNWSSFTDFVALYSPQLSGGLLHSASRFDTFTFQLNVVPQMETDEICDKIEFAVRYLVGPDGSWGQYWDNNAGKNYLIEKRVVQSHWPNQVNEAHANTKPLTRSSTCDCNFDDFGTAPTTAPPHFHPYTHDYRPNFEGISQFTSYRAWTHFAGETTYY